MFLWVLSHFSAPSLSIPNAFLCVIYFPEETFQGAQSLRTLKFRWMIMSIVKEAVKLSPGFWLLSPEPQELIVWMVMRPGRQQMLACLYNPNPTNKFLPQKLWGTSWHPGDGHRPSHSHMPPARPIVKKKKKRPITITKLFAVFCNDFMALVLPCWQNGRKRNIWFFREKHLHPKQLTTYVERLMFSIWCVFFW